jgi:hypothetical protein
MKGRLVAVVGVFCIASLIVSVAYADKPEGKNRVPTSICMEVTGEIIGGDIVDGSWEEACACNNILLRDSGKYQTQLVVRPVHYNLSYFQSQDFKGHDGAKCFQDDLYYNLPLVVVREDDGSAWVRFTFYAYANDGETVVHYGLDMFGEFVGEYPPVGTTYIDLTHWEMSSWGRGKLKHISCTGGGTFSEDPVTTIEVRNAGACPN